MQNFQTQNYYAGAMLHVLDKKLLITSHMLNDSTTMSHKFLYPTFASYVRFFYTHKKCYEKER